MTGAAVASVALSRWTATLDRWRITHPRTAAGLVYAALGLLLAIPILVMQVPLGGDDLNHLARIYVRAHIDQDPDLARIFRIKHELIPYLGMDVLLTPLARVLPIMLVGRLYLLALVWGLVGAVAVLRRAFVGHVGLVPAAAGLIAYNGVLAWGLLNYALGLILALLAFAAWHALRERAWLLRAVVFTALATVIYLTHLLAFVLYGVLVVAYELFGRPKPWRTPIQDWLLLAGQASPGLLLWIAVNPRPFTPAFLIQYDPPSALGLVKTLILESPFLFRGASGGAYVSPDTGLFTAAACTMGLYFGRRNAWFTWPRALAGPALSVLALALLLPERVYGITLIDGRFPLAAAGLALAGLRVTPAAPRRLALPAAAAVAVLSVAHVADVSLLAHRCNGQYAELRRAMSALPRGAELSSVLEPLLPRPPEAATNLSVYLQMPQLVTIDRSGYEPDFYTLTTSVAVLGGRKSDANPTPADQFTVAPKSGYVLWLHFGRRRPVPPGLALVRRGSFFDLWKATS